MTGDYIKAIILNQFLYWTDRMNGVDNFITEERKRLEQEGLSVDMELQKGWIYKTAEDLLDEIMLGMAQTTIRVHIKKLLETGYLLERNNPKFKWDKTKQYRVDLLKIQTDLFKHGYTLQGYKLPLIIAPISETKLPSSESELREYENRGAIPDITSKTKSNIKTIADTKTVSAHKQIIDHYHNKFLAKYEVKPFINGKTGKDVKSLLGNNAELDAQKVIILLDRYFDDNDDFIVKNRHSFSVFMSRINQLNTVNNTPKQSTSSQDRGGCYRIIGDNDPDYQAWLAMQEGE